jgi:hypothetical protein
MNVDTKVLDQLQDGSMNDAQKHELIYDILKAQAEKAPSLIDAEAQHQGKLRGLATNYRSRENLLVN